MAGRRFRALVCALPPEERPRGGGEGIRQSSGERIDRPLAGPVGGPAPISPGGPDPGPGTPAPQLPKRFHGSATLEATRVGRDAGRIADEVIAHLTALVGSEVKITLEIEAQVPNGIPENTVRTVTENSRTLKFDTHGFEKE
jgi:hypothetical protein